MDKDALRFEAKRNCLKAALQSPANASEIIKEIIKERINFSLDFTIAGYFPFSYEIDMLNMAHALPVIEKDTRILRFARWSDETPLESGSFGIKQPKEKNYVRPDVLLVPILAFDRRGTRLGQGGGYYDATIENLRKNGEVLTIGIAHAQQACLFPLPREGHDQPMDWIVTPQGAQRF